MMVKVYLSFVMVPLSAPIGPIGPCRPLSAPIGPCRPLSAPVGPYRPYRPLSAPVGPYRNLSLSLYICITDTFS